MLWKKVWRLYVQLAWRGNSSAKHATERKASARLLNVAMVMNALTWDWQEVSAAPKV